MTADFLDDTHSVVTGLAGLLAPPFVNETRGLIDESGGLLEDIDLLLDKIEHLLSEIGPLLEQLGEINLGDSIYSVSGRLTPDAIRSIGNLINNLSHLLTHDIAPLTSAVTQFVSLITALLGGGGGGR